MKKWIWVCLSILAMNISALDAFAEQTALEEIKAAGKMVVSTDANYAPQSFIGPDGKLDGFDISVAREAARRMGVKAEFVTPVWDLITAGKWGKRWDVSIGSMTPTVERKKVLWFTTPYYSSPAQFAVHKDNTTIKKLSDLAGKRIGVTSETTNERYLKKELSIVDVDIEFQDWTSDKIVYYETDANEIEDLALGDGVRLDAVFTSRQTIAEAIHNGCGKGCPIKMVGAPPYSEPLAFALDKSRPNSESLLKKFNEIIKEMYDDGTLVKLSMKYFKTDLIPKL